MLSVSRERFEELVGDALDRIPPELTRLMDNVVVLVEDESPKEPGESELLGRYEGTPLTERWGDYAGVLPDRITLFRNPLLRVCGSAAELVRQVEITVVHEVGHHFGIDDRRLHELGYG